jgi:hypothetical protein
MDEEDEADEVAEEEEVDRLGVVWGIIVVDVVEVADVEDPTEVKEREAGDREIVVPIKLILLGIGLLVRLEVVADTVEVVVEESIAEVLPIAITVGDGLTLTLTLLDMTGEAEENGGEELLVGGGETVEVLDCDRVCVFVWGISLLSPIVIWAHNLLNTERGGKVAVRLFIVE